MKLLVIGVAAVIVLGVILVGAHMALIEIGREVVTLRTPVAGGGWQETRLWIVDDGPFSWVHSAGEPWLRRFDGDPIVEVERNGEIERFQAVAVPGPHPRVDQLLREKYGVADRWVRFIAPCGPDTVPVRLEHVWSQVHTVPPIRPADSPRQPGRSRSARG